MGREECNIVPPGFPRRFFRQLIVWSILVIAGFGILTQYSNTAGDDGAPSPQWPDTSSLVRSPDRATLVMFLHPHCPCSQASLEELSRIVAHGGNCVGTHVVFVRPDHFPPLWEQTALWSAAVAMPGVQVNVDVDGVEARRFGVATSGSVLLFNASGLRLFNGGITGGRGHAGDNPGGSAVLSGLRTGRAKPDHAPVFGCPLLDREIPSIQEVATCRT